MTFALINRKVSLGPVFLASPTLSDSNLAPPRGVPGMHITLATMTRVTYVPLVLCVSQSPFEMSPKMELVYHPKNPQEWRP